MNTIVEYFLNVPMSYSHPGLRDVALKGGRDLNALKPGEFVLFCNRPFNAVKMFGSANTFVYHRNPSDRPLNPRALMKAVECFDGVAFDYKAALADELESRLAKELRSIIKSRRAREEDPLVPRVLDPKRFTGHEARAKRAKAKKVKVKKKR